MRRVATFVKWLVLALIVTLVVIFAVNNSAYVSVTLFPLPYEIDTPLFLLTMLAFCAGILTGGLMMSLRALRIYRVFKRSHRRVDALEHELIALRAQQQAHSLPATTNRAA